MAKKVEIKKTVFDRRGYKGVIDNKFKFFKELEPVVDPDTVEELFRLYDKLYALIPIEGEDNSHQYLVERSSELYQIDTQLESIQPLLDEVASLRNQLLENNRRILELETQLAGGGELDFASAEQMQLLKTQLETANSTIATLEQANTIANKATEEAAKASAKAAEEAKKAAQQQAAQAAVTSGAAFEQGANEIVDLMKNKTRSNLSWAKRFLEKPSNYYRQIDRRRGRNRNYSGYGNHSWFRQSDAGRFWWLFTDEETAEAREYYSNRRRRGFRFRQPRDFTYFIPNSKNQAGDMTLDYLVDELKQAGYKAQEMKLAFEKISNFKNNVRTRIITYKDKDREDELGYTFID